MLVMKSICKSCLQATSDHHSHMSARVQDGVFSSTIIMKMSCFFEKYIYRIRDSPVIMRQFFASNMLEP